jgi:dihydrofolate reductase
MVIGIVAVDRNGAIGKNGKLPWHYSADMKHFKETTLGNACVMGRKTFLTLKKPLVDRLNIVLTRQPDLEAPDSVVVVRDLSSVLSRASDLKTDLFVIGGEQVFSAFLPFIEKWVVTEVPLSVEGADAFVPQDYLRGFSQTQEKDLGDGLVVKYYDRNTQARLGHDSSNLYLNSDGCGDLSE